ncbi:GapS6b family protein [Alkalimonas amylolytica]|uniref:PIN domain-containing protein n=1 Tax=Alkalimonas amylolytica TaxID=152573 RepID=A0A1H4EAS7_ALKAM|nr:hypothetical protein [Alkalimonas amylolytica]SEA82046.1 hypothetical protein SAMN04488051_106317 [Alkalimonas amylolytica]SEA97838.1 hypothetical protein SAMN04488051_11137 [Alkalimonas amylolytica]SEB02718.1 hypothetical protein SAMN04488051_1152 [Alkalimonas amylolytica]
MSSRDINQASLVGHNINASDNATVNVGGINYIISGITSNDLVGYSKRFLKEITHRNIKSAKIYLNSLDYFDSLDHDSRSINSVFKFKLSLYNGGEVQKIDRELFLDLIKNKGVGPVMRDIVESIFIEYLSMSSNCDARERYNKIEDKTDFTNEIFYEKVANLKDLYSRVDAGLSNVSENELCALVRCAFRCEDINLAVQLSTQLNTEFPNINSDILLVLARAYQNNKEIGAKHFWLIDRCLMTALEGLVDRCINLSEETADPRVTRIAAVLLASTWYQNQKLAKLCLDNITEAEKANPNIGRYIKPNNETSCKVKNINYLLKDSRLTIDEVDLVNLFYAYFDHGISKRDLMSWHRKGGRLNSKKYRDKDFLDLLFNILVLDSSDGKDKIDLSRRVESFLEKHSSKLNEFNVMMIHCLCKGLLEFGLAYHVVRLLEPLIPQFPWISPAIDTYAQALLASDQHEKLEYLLESLKGLDDSYVLRLVKIERACFFRDYDNAVKLSELAVKNYPNSCYCWCILLRNLHLSKCEHSVLQTTLEIIPDDVLNRYSEDGLRLLHLISKTDSDFANSIILEWFIDDPVGMALHVTNLHFSQLEHWKEQSYNKYPSNRCSQAVVYSIGKRQLTKLLVDNADSSEYLIDTASPVGIALVEASEGEEIKIGATIYRVEEKLPPIVGSFRISTDIRDNINAGNDCFYKFTIEENCVEDILQFIGGISDGPKLFDSEIDGNKIPLLMRLNKTHSSDLIRGAVLYLCDHESNRYFYLFSQGESVEHGVILDVLSLVYLALTGLGNTDVKFYVTPETYDIVSEWLTRTGRSDYLSIAKLGDSFVKTTSENVRNDLFYNNLNHIFGLCEIISPKRIDMLGSLTKIRDVLDVSHYSSLKSSISHGLPFLCLDQFLCAFYRSLNIRLVNAKNFLSDINAKLPINHKYNAECFVELSLDVPVSFNDVFELCCQKGRGQYLAAEVIRKHSHGYPSYEAGLRVLTECCTRALSSAFVGCNGRIFDAKGQLKLSQWCHTVNIVYACCRSAMIFLDGVTSEQRLSKLIVEVLTTFVDSKRLAVFSMFLFQRFVNGHFLSIDAINVEITSLMGKNTRVRRLEP